MERCSIGAQPTVSRFIGAVMKNLTVYFFISIVAVLFVRAIEIGLLEEERQFVRFHFLFLVFFDGIIHFRLVVVKRATRCIIVCILLISKYLGHIFEDNFKIY